MSIASTKTMTMMLTRERQFALVTLAGRAPSPHNIQPARWRFDGDAVELWEDPARRLAASDPTGRDNRIALGMAWEGMAIALSAEGLSVALEARPPLDYPPAASDLRLVARGRIEPGAGADALRPSLPARASYRGVFAPATGAQREALEACIDAHRHVALALPAAALPQLAQWHDAAIAEGLRDAAFADELYRWMRFSPRDPRWARDGLSAECLALSRFQAWGASIALRPAIYKVLSRLPLGPQLASEAAQVRSATCCVLIHTPANRDVFDTGRAWYRFWLALDREGFAGVPMSALADSPAHAQRLLDAWPLPAERRLVNVMRLGPRPRGEVVHSARLPADELLVA
jgi:hypothetical protein